MNHKHYRRILKDSIDDIADDICLTKTDDELIHYSSKKGIKVLDPSKMGTGVKAAQTKRGVPEHKSTFFYTSDSKPESMVATPGKSIYKVKLDSNHKIYDLDKDSENLIKESLNRNQGAWSEDVFHGLVKEKGYHGVKWSMRPETKVVQMYYETKPYAEEINKGDLEKGAARRLYGKIDPLKLPNREKVKEWQTSTGALQDLDLSYDDDTHQAAREDLPKMDAGLRLRALNKLSKRTLTRKHPETGERQFLLFRGIGEDELHTVYNKNIHNPSSYSSWTPYLSVARISESERSDDYNNGKTIAAWINESDIHSAPHMYGNIPDLQIDMDNAAKFYVPEVRKPGKNEFSFEYEIIVKPHKSIRATKEDVKRYQLLHNPTRSKISMSDPKKYLNARINYRGEQEKIRGLSNKDNYIFRTTQPLPNSKINLIQDSKKPKKLAASEFAKSIKISIWEALEDLEKSEAPNHEGQIDLQRGRIGKKHPNGTLMWHHIPEIANKNDSIINNKTHINNFLSKIPHTHRPLMMGIIKHIANDPNRHFIPTEENGTNKLRARHLKDLLLGNKDINIDTSTPGTIKISRISHSQGKNFGRSINFLFFQKKSK